MKRARTRFVPGQPAGGIPLDGGGLDAEVRRAQLLGARQYKRRRIGAIH